MNRKKHHSVIERVEQARLQSQINQNFANELIQSIEEEKKRNNASFLLGIKTLLVICFALLIALFLILDRNNALEEDIEMTQKAGMNGFIAKPLDAEKMFTILKQSIVEN